MSSQKLSRRSPGEGQVVSADDVRQLHKLQRKRESGELDDSEAAVLRSLSQSLQSSTGMAPRITLGSRALSPVGPNLALWMHASAEGEMENGAAHNVRELIDHSPTAVKSDITLKFTRVHRNLAVADLVEKALQEKGTHLVSSGALATLTGAKTGRSPADKRIVLDDSEPDVWWGEGSPNRPIDENAFLRLRERALDYLQILDEVFVFDGYAGWEEESRVSVRVIAGRAYHAMFMHNLLIRPTKEELRHFKPDVHIYNAGAFPCNRYTQGMSSSTSVALSLTRRELVILGTQYAGEMKKGVFSLMHYLFPKCHVLSLHSGCNIGSCGDVSLFFGLSGTGKTTLSTDPHRPLIGDDEHGWGENGIFNIEGGCYAKCIDLDPDAEPEIYEAIRFGTVLENVVFTERSRDVDFHDCSLTENTRAAYPIQFISNARIPCIGPHPKNIIMLCCDAYGVLPPVSKLTPAQTMYHFVSGYTAKVAGTEQGVTEPQATFSACFGGAFLVMHPYKYAALLAEKMVKHDSAAWLVNTGWTGGRYGVGRRIKLKYTRAIIDAIHSGELKAKEYVNTPVFNLQVPQECPGVPSKMLLPETQWDDENAFVDNICKLGVMFNDNFRKFSNAGGPGMIPQELVDEIMQAAPVVEDLMGQPSPEPSPR